MIFLSALLIQGQRVYSPILLGISFTKVESRAVIGIHQFQQHVLQPNMRHTAFFELSSLIQMYHQSLILGLYLIMILSWNMISFAFKTLNGFSMQLHEHSIMIYQLFKLMSAMMLYIRPNHSVHIYQGLSTK